jgi:isoquinoline 1-oxidoreductase beta subunit
MEGGIIFGLTTALKAAISIEQGRVQQSNFHDYPLLRLDEAPMVEVFIVPSTESPTGIGEMSNPVIMPAVANAIFAATGKRIRRLPIKPEDLKAA